MIRCLVVPQATERFDAEGGAVAAWISAVYSRQTSLDATVLAVHASGDLHPALRFDQSRLYDAYDTLVRRVTAMLVRSLELPYTATLSRLLLREYWFRRMMVRRSKTCDIIHVHNRPRYVVHLRRAGYRGRVLLHMHNDLAAYLNPRIAESLFRDVDEIVFCSEAMRAQATERYASVAPTGFFERSTRVVYNGVSVAEVPLGAGRDESLILTAGRVIEEKGTVESVLVCKELAERGLGVRLELIGGTASGMANPETAYLRRVREAVADANSSTGRPDAVSLIGPLPHDELRSRMSQSSVLLLPCRWEEPFGMVAIEAMSVGAIPVVPDRGGLPEVVGDAGVVVPYFDDKAKQVQVFADCVEQLLVQGVTGQQRENARARARVFDWSTITQTFESAAASILARQ